MLGSRLERKFFWWGVAFTATGGMLAGLVHRAATPLWGFPWDFLLTIAVLVLIWLVPLWIALHEWVLRPIVRVQEADRRVIDGQTDVFLPDELIPENEIGDLMRTRNEMLTGLKEKHEVLERTAERLQALYTASKEMVGLLGAVADEEELLSRVLAVTCQLTGARYGVIGLVNEAGEHVSFVQHGLTDEEVARIGDLPRGIGMLGKILEYGREDPDRAFIVDDLTKHPLHSSFPPHHPVMKTLLGVPIASADRVYGRVYLTEKTSGQRFTGEDASLVRSLANIVAMRLAERDLIEQLSASRRRYQELYDTAPVGLDELDADGTIVAMNQTLLSWLGYRREEIVGVMQYERLLTAEGREKFREIERRCSRGEAVESVDLELRRKDGSFLPVRVSTAPVLDAEGRMVACRSVTRDVRRERELEQQLAQAQRLETIGTLAGGMAHDFNNSLHVILGYAELALGKVDPSQPVHRDLSEIKDAVQRSRDLVQKLLAFSRRQVLETRAVSLNDVVLDVSKILRRLIPESIDLRTRMGAGPDTVLADLASLEQILVNLVLNARDAMPEGGTLTIGTDNATLDEAYCQRYPDARPGEYVRLTVSDTGVGMDDAILPRIFEPFFTTKGPGEGSGLGLSMVWGLVKQHDGHIAVFSKPGQGTTLKIYLPVHGASSEHGKDH